MLILNEVGRMCKINNIFLSKENEITLLKILKLWFHMSLQKKMIKKVSKEVIAFSREFSISKIKNNSAL